MTRILIWGTGIAARKFIRNGVPGEIIGYIETYKKQDSFCAKKVYQYTDLPKEYDAIVVANKYTSEIYLSAKKQQIDIDKMIFMFPCTYVQPIEKLEWVKQIIGEKNYEIYLGAYGLYNKSFFVRDMQQYQILNKRESFEVNKQALWPVISDKFDDAGIIRNYFWQDLWAAKLVFDNKPKIHYDIGSRLDGFIAHILAMGIPVKMIDIRPFPMEIVGLDTIVDDATYLRQFENNSIESLSALCSLEHFGLGRYGDPIDPEACFKCFEAIQKKLKLGGHLYLAVPVGRERLEFNAHRVFYASTIVEEFSNLKLEEYSCVSQGDIEHHVDIYKYDNDDHNGEWRYGLFHFVK